MFASIFSRQHQDPTILFPAFATEIKSIQAIAAALESLHDASFPAPMLL
jgi:hypothetical protein